ncbi:rhodanese-like domain-containing protein [Nitrosomonas sp. Nm34]|uniref:rhodanese-like domain-containing protein n=1 Tax=Nitrosomonas sp. Nm34 TaxID=1881055 RepID=UPI0008EDE6B6|nr:rhodanese-like domain-containing protein [Nitrosomonas sp. Nm34]SFJ13570.1 hypothetical protein SAMN05428978_11242 [Nitrosomonas sp. Nm34]
MILLIRENKHENNLNGVVALMAADCACQHPGRDGTETSNGAITINTETAKLLFDRGYLFVDMRKLEDFNQGDIPGAQHLAVNSALFTASNLAG